MKKSVLFVLFFVISLICKAQNTTFCAETVEGDRKMKFFDGGWNKKKDAYVMYPGSIKIKLKFIKYTADEREGLATNWNVYYNEIINGKVTGTYTLFESYSGHHNVYYKNAKSGKEFFFMEISKDNKCW